MGDGGGSGGPGARAAGTWGAGSASLVLPTQVLLERELEQLSEELDKDMRAMETRRHPCQVPRPLPTRASLALACCPSSLPGLGGPEERCRADGAHIQLRAHPAACTAPVQVSNVRVVGCGHGWMWAQPNNAGAAGRVHDWMHARLDACTVGRVPVWIRAWLPGGLAAVAVAVVAGR